MDETSPLLTELRDRQRRLAEALDALDHRTGLAELTPLIQQVVASRDAIPRFEHRMLRDRYAPGVRALGIGIVVAGLAAVAGVIVRWIDPWLTLMVIPLLLLGTWLAVRATGDGDRIEAGTPRERLVAGVAGAVAIVLVIASGLVSGWFLIGAIPAALAAIAVATLTGPPPDLTSGEVADA